MLSIRYVKPYTPVGISRLGLPKRREVIVISNTNTLSVGDSRLEAIAAKAQGCDLKYAKPVLGHGEYKAVVFGDPESSKPVAIFVNDTSGSGTWFTLADASRIPLYVWKDGIYVKRRKR